MFIRACKTHGAGTRQSLHEQMRITVTHQSRRTNRADCSIGCMRVDTHCRERKRARKTPCHFISNSQQPQQLAQRQRTRLCLRQQRRQYIGPCMTRRQSISLVQLAPCGSHAIGCRGMQHIGFGGALCKNGCRFFRRYLRCAFAYRLDLRLTRSSNHRTHIVQQNQRRALTDHIWQILPARFYGPFTQPLQSARGLFAN